MKANFQFFISFILIFLSCSGITFISIKNFHIESAAPLLKTQDSKPLEKEEHYISSQTTTESDLRDPFRIERITLAKGESIKVMLNKFGIPSSSVDRIIKLLSAQISLNHLKAGQHFDINYTLLDDNSKQVDRIEFYNSLNKKFILNFKNINAPELKVLEIPFKKQSIHIGGTIDKSFYGAAKKLDVPAKIINQAAKALNHSINIQHIKADQPFELYFDKFTNEVGNASKIGELKYLSIKIGNKTCKLYRFIDSAGHAGFYNEMGEGVERSLLMTPVDMKRVVISSKFGMRVHPIRGYSIKHKGIDIAAPSGTRVIAAGNGVITRAGYSGNYGNMVRIRHEGGYETVYAHLKKIEVRVGSRVAQGQKIGEVGMTGMATGPHLHHEVLFKNTHINPQSIKQLPTRKLSGKELISFKKFIHSIEKEIEIARTANA